MPADRHAPPPSEGRAATAATPTDSLAGEAAPGYSSHQPNPFPAPAVAAGGKLWSDEDQQKADYFLSRDGWLPCFGCGSEGPYPRYGDHSYCATCIREGVPWADAAKNAATPEG